MSNALLIERLYAHRRRLTLRVARLEKAIASDRTLIAKIETELSGLALVVPPMIQRKPNPHFVQGEMAQRCRNIMRENRTPMYVGEIVAAIMNAKGLSVSDVVLRQAIGRQARNALWYMWKRDGVVKSGNGLHARWGLISSDSRNEHIFSFGANRSDGPNGRDRGVYQGQVAPRHLCGNVPAGYVGRAGDGGFPAGGYITL
jgi:hypothetical protein